MDENAKSDNENDDFPMPEIEKRLPKSKIRSFLYNCEYPSDMALHYLFIKKIYNTKLSDTFFEIAKKNPTIIIETKSFDSNWITSFVESTMNCSNILLLRLVYYHFFDIIASKNYTELNENLSLFLELTKEPNHQFTELYHCRIISMILIQKFNIDFDPNEIHKISDFDTRNLHKILEGHLSGLSEYLSTSLVSFAIIYCIPSAVIKDEYENYKNRKKVPDLIQIIPEPELIFYNYKYYNDDIFNFCIFLFQAIYGYVQNEIDTFNEKSMLENNDNFGIINDDTDNPLYINNPQLKIKSLLDLFLNNSVVTGAFLRIILMFNQSNAILYNSDTKEIQVQNNTNTEVNNCVLFKITQILFQCPKIRLSILLRCQHLLSFFELYSKYHDSVFDPIGGSFFANIPNKFAQFSLYQALYPYWAPQNFIIKIYDHDNPSLLIPHAISMINRCRLESPEFINNLSQISIIQISAALTQIFDYLVLCDNFSSKQTEMILFMGISNFFQMSRKNRPSLIQNRYLHHITITALFKSLLFIFKTPQYNIVSEYGLLQRHAYRIICSFIRENIDLFKDYVNSYNNINDFYQRSTIIQAIHPRFSSVMLYFQIYLRATTYQQFWLALKFMKSLTYTDEDVGIFIEMVFNLNNPILTKNAILLMTELILNKDGFGEMIIQNESFPDFIVQIVKSFSEEEIGNAALFLLHSLYKRNLIKPEHKIRIQYLQFFFDNILSLHDELFQILCDISMMICMCNKLKRFPFKIKHQKQAFNRPDSIEKNNFLVFLFINYPELSNRIQKPPKSFEVKIQKKILFSFMNIINKPFRYLITPVLFDGSEILKENENFDFIHNQGNNPSFLISSHLNNDDQGQNDDHGQNNDDL